MLQKDAGRTCEEQKNSSSMTYPGALYYLLSEVLQYLKLFQYHVAQMPPGSHLMPGTQMPIVTHVPDISTNVFSKRLNVIIFLALF